jgi:plastocyanin
MKINKSIRLTMLTALVITGVVLVVSCGTASPSATPTATQAAQVKPTEPGATPGPDFKPVAVAIENFAFSPAAISVSIGTTVTWTNKDTVQHTVTSLTSVFDSGLFGKDKSFSFTFNQVGTYEYYCLPHPYMTGKVIVE